MISASPVSSCFPRLQQASICGTKTPRLIGVGQVSLVDPERAVTEIKEGVKLGCGAFWIPGMPAGTRAPGHTDLDPVWQTLCDLNIPFMLHVGPNSQLVSKA